MSDKKGFVDSNVLLYLFGLDVNRKKTAFGFLNQKYFISTQVVNENVNVCLKKLRLAKVDAFSHGENLLKQLSITYIYNSTILDAYRISIDYGYSFWDSLIISSALENDCEILYSEDMQTGHVIDGKLEIVNPFI